MLTRNFINMQSKKMSFWLGCFVAILSSVLFISSCSKKFDEPPIFQAPNITANKTIAALKAAHVSGQVESITDDLIIEGIVNADDRSGNYYKQISIQDATGGITIRLDGTNLYSSYPVGRKIYIKLKGLFMGDYNGLIQIGGSSGLSGGFLNVNPLASNLFDTYIIKGSLDNPVPAKLVTFADLNSSLQSMLIQIDNAEFVTGDTSKTYADVVNSLSVNLNVKTCSGSSTVIVRTSGYANFAGINAPNGNGSLFAIYTTFGTTKQLIVRDTSDVKFYGTRCSGSTPPGGGSMISIAALRALHTGTDVAITTNTIKGIVISDPNNIGAGNIVLQDGNSGIDLFFGTSAASALSAFAVGDSLVVDISGGSLQLFNGMLEVVLSSSAVPAAAAGTVATGSGKSVSPVTRTIADIATNMATIENTLVKIDNATATSGTYSGNKTLTDASGTMTMRTLTTATFAGTDLPLTCQNWVGYVNRFTTTNQLYIRTLADVTAGSSCGVTPPPTGGAGIDLGSTSPFLIDFNGIGSALPTGVDVYVSASASALGTPSTFTSAATRWAITSGGFYNFASATGLTSATIEADQTAATNRALGVRQVSGTSSTFPGTDPGAAFIFQLNNTTGKSSLKLDFLLQSLDVASARTTKWTVDYALGASPAAFTSTTATGTVTTGNASFSSNAVHVDLPAALNNQSGKVWIRITAIDATTGSGSRASSAIDDFKISW